MQITSADIYRIDYYPRTHSWNPIILRLWTDEGLYGLGEVALAYGTGARAAVGMLRDVIEAHVLGADPLPIEAMWHTLFRRTLWGQGGGPVVYGAMSAIDEALWDIKGKAYGVPVHALLGGKTRDSIRVYANGWSNRRTPEGRTGCVTPAEFAEAAQRVVADGFDAKKFDPFNVLADGRRVAPERALDKEQADLAYARVAAVREAVGPDVDILVEVHGSLGTTSAIEVGRRLAELKPFFYEEPVDAMNVEAMKKVGENVPIPIAAGERLYTRYGFRAYIESQAIDILQPDVGLAGGLTEAKKIAAYAETYDLHVQPHNCAGPVATAAAVQLDACITNFLIQEWFPYRDQGLYDLVEGAQETRAVNGRYAIPGLPGLGVTLNEEVVGRYPCTRVT